MSGAAGRGEDGTRRAGRRGRGDGLGRGDRGPTGQA